MSVYRSKKSPYWQYDFVYQGQRFYGSTGAKTEAKARRVENAKRIAAAAGELSRRAAPTLDLAATEWWEFKGKYLKSASILETRLDTAVRLVGPDKAVDEITTADIAEAIAKRRGILVGEGPTAHLAANSTVNRDIIDTIRPIIRRQRKLLNDGKGAKVLFPEIDWKELRLKEPRPQPRDFTGGEQDAVLAALPTWWRDFAETMRLYGCRLGEMFFPPSAIDVAGRTLTLGERKNGSIHVIPITKATATMFARRLSRAQAAGLPTIWYRELKGGRLKALTRGGALQAMRRAMRKSGLHASKGAKGAHDLRHHAAMRYLRTTKDLRGTQQLLGHQDIRSTLVYAHALVDDLRAGLDAVSRNSPGRKTQAKKKAKQGGRLAKTSSAT